MAQRVARSAAQILSAPAAAPVASKSLAEAQQRARYFFRELAREIPWIMKNYQLEEITTRPVLRRQLADHFRRVTTDNPKVIDVLLFKGQAEAHEVLAHYTQRHHLITRYVAPRESAAAAAANLAAGPTPRSGFFTKFLSSNNTD